MSHVKTEARFKKGSGTFAGTARRVLRTKVPDPFLNHVRERAAHKELFNSSLVIYLMMGTAMAFAVYVADRAATRTERSFRVLTAVVFWPLYVPLLLRVKAPPAPPVRCEPLDHIALAIAQVDGELHAALGSLGGWAEGVLAREKDRLNELRSAWTAQADRVRDIDRLLSMPEYTARLSCDGVNQRLLESEQTRQRHLDRIHRLRERALRRPHGNVGLDSRAGLDDSPGQVHGGMAPASRAEELVAQIAAAVEGLSEVVTWEDDVETGPRDQAACGS